MASLLIRDLDTVVTCDDADSVLRHVDLYCEDGRIRAIGPDLAVQADEVLDGSHLLCYPGLINTHHHLYQQFSRNLPEVQNLELFPWLKALYEIWKNLDTEVVRYSSLTGMGELMKNGCTTCFDHHYVFPAGCGDLLGAQFAAADELGMRMVASRGSIMSACTRTLPRRRTRSATPLTVMACVPSPISSRSAGPARTSGSRTASTLQTRSSTFSQRPERAWRTAPFPT